MTLTGHRLCIAALLDQLVGSGQQRFWYGEAERLCGLEVDDHLELGRLLNRKIARLLALENPASIFAHHVKVLVSVRSVAHKAAGQRELASKVHGGNRKLLRRRHDFIGTGEGQRTLRDQERIESNLGQACQCRIKLAVGAGNRYTPFTS